MVNMDNPNKKWYQKKRFIIPAIALAIIIGLNSGGNSPKQSVTAPQNQGTYSTYKQPASAIKAVETPSQNNNLSNNNSYVNVDGNTVHSPAYSQNGQAPDGATAQCRDGTYSFSQNRRGTCSHHGGVDEWLY